MTPTQLKTIEEHLAEYLAQTGIREELRHWIDNNAILDESGEEVELNVNSFDWNFNLELTYDKENN